MLLIASICPCVTVSKMHTVGVTSDLLITFSEQVLWQYLLYHMIGMLVSVD